MTLTAIDLIEKIIEFKAMTPKQDDWNCRALTNNKPRLIRFQQIRSLLMAFEIILFNKGEKDSLLNEKNQNLTKDGILAVLNGNFVESRELGLYKKLILYIEKNNLARRPLDISQLKSFYSYLLQYRISLYDVLNMHRGYLEASAGTIAAYKFTKKLNSDIRRNMKTLDEYLSLLIDPKERVFTDSELIENYYYPKDDLSEIDIDYM